jgi:peptidoglycan hydrolase-like protein with peptidoglycan-binding domain
MPSLVTFLRRAVAFLRRAVAFLRRAVGRAFRQRVTTGDIFNALADYAEALELRVSEQDQEIGRLKRALSDLGASVDNPVDIEVRSSLASKLL